MRHPLRILVLSFLLAWLSAADIVLAQCSVEYTITDDWGSGFVADVQIRNTGPTINGWTLTWNFSGGQTISNSWSSYASQTGGAVSVINAAWNAAMTTGSSVRFGFEAAYPTTNPAPSGFSLNGTACTATVTTAPTPTPGAPTPTPTALGPVLPLPYSDIPWPDRVFAPFVDATGYPLFPMVDVAQQQGARFFALGFVVAAADGGCEPSWGTYYPIGSYLRSEIAALRTLGADVIVSFGGAANTELAVACGNASSLAARYQDVIDAYGLTHIDFDIEGAWVADHSSIDRRSAAIALLQQTARAAGRPLAVWLTLPVLPSGLTADGLHVVDSALANGVDIAGVNIMAMDYGDSAAPDPAGRMGEYAMTAAASLHAQLTTLFAAHSLPASPAELWKKVGVTPMIGLNDVVTETFDLEDAGELLQFAIDNDLGMLSMWSANRDTQCAGGRTSWVDISCSSILQSPFAFSTIFNGFRGDVVPTATPTPAPAEPCPATPSDTCDSAANSVLRIRDGAGARRDRFAWQWSGSVGSGMGDPLVATSYRICLYDSRAGTPELVGEWQLPAAGTCGARPCWRANRTGYRFRNRAAAAGYVGSAHWMRKSDGSLKLQLQAKGESAALPAPFNAAVYFGQDPAVQLQLLSSDGTCRQATFDGTAIYNRPDAFHAVTPPS